MRIPRIHWETTTRRVLTMEFLPGEKIHDPRSSEPLPPNREEAVRWATRAFLHMIFKDGFFHCDPHPGNLLVDGEGRVGIVDFGMNQRIEPAALEGLRQNVFASMRRDPELYARWLQWGVHAPVFRTHSTKDAAFERRPWAWPLPYAEALAACYRRRAQLVPHLHTLAARAERSGVAPLHPLYYDWPEWSAAYAGHDPPQFMLGTTILGAPASPSPPALSLIKTGYARVCVCS